MITAEPLLVAMADPLAVATGVPARTASAVTILAVAAAVIVVAEVDTTTSKYVEVTPVTKPLVTLFAAVANPVTVTESPTER